MTKTYLIPLLVAASLSGAAVANPVDNYYAARDIVQARYASAISQLESQYARDPSDESVLLNLALAYRHAGRETDAQHLYRKVLTMTDYELDSAGGKPIWAHDLARRSLATTIVLSAR